MTHTSSGFSKKSLIVGLLVALVTIIVPGAQAAFTNHFDVLEAELQSRSTALTGSIDKDEQKQKKAVDKVIVTIDKPATTLAADVKTAGKIAKSLIKSFPSEFVSTLVFTNDLSTLLDATFEALATDVAAQLTALSNTVSALPDGSAKVKASASIVTAQAALNAADTAPDYAAASKALGSALKAISSGNKSAGSGGGGSGCGSSSVIMTVSNEGPQWIADVPSAYFRPDTGDLAIGGIRGTTPFDTVAVGLFPVDPHAGNVDYNLGLTSDGGSTAYVTDASTTNAVLYELISGTMHVAAINAGAVGAINGTVSGTFHFTANQVLDTNIVITIDGTFNICNMVSLPPLP